MKKIEVLHMQIKRIEKEIRDTPYHKGTEHHIGRLRARLAKLKDELEGDPKGGGGGGGGYAIRHSGDVTVVLVGPPSAGKSTLLNHLSNAKSKVASYDFTTINVIPGMMNYKGAQIQIFDLPGLITGASRNRGFGKRVLSVIRGANLIILISDVKRIRWIEKVINELESAGIRINKTVPKISVKKNLRGSIRVINPYHTFDKETVVAIAQEYGLKNGEIKFEEKTADLDKLIDIFSSNRVYKPTIKVINKIDERKIVKRKSDYLYISAEKNLGIEKLKEVIWENLAIVRVFLKKDKNSQADKEDPLIIKMGSSLQDVLNQISSEMASDVKEAFIWGKNAKFPGQKVSLKTKVFDEIEVYFGK